MLVWPVFAMGVVNFFFHRAVMEGRGPVFAEIAAALRRFGRGFGGYAIEFALLLLALRFAHEGARAALIAYGLYTALNVGGYMLLSQMNRD